MKLGVVYGVIMGVVGSFKDKFFNFTVKGINS